MNHENQLIKNTFIIALGKLGTQIVSFLLLPLYTEKLVPSEMGIYDFLVTLCNFLQPIITLLMEESMFRFLIDAETTKEKKKVITATIIYISFGTLLFVLIAGLICGFTHYEYGLLFIVFVISNILISLSNALARGMGKLKLYSISNFVLGASTIVLNVIFIISFRLGAKGLLLSNTIANTMTALVILARLRIISYISKKSISGKLLKKMVRFSVPLVPNNLSWVIISVSDRLMLTWMVSADANGLYSIANRFPNIVYTCYMFFSTAWKETSAKIAKEEDKVKRAKEFNKIYREVKSLVRAVTVGLIAVMPFAFEVLINKSYADAYIYIPLLTLSVYYMNLSNFYGGIFQAFKSTKIMGYTTAIGAAVNVLINLIFMRIWGIWAATISTIVSSLIVYAYRKYKVNKYIRLREKINYIYWILLAITIITYYVGNQIISALVLAVVVAYCVYTNKNILRKIMLAVKNRITA